MLRTATRSDDQGPTLQRLLLALGVRAAAALLVLGSGLAPAPASAGIATRVAAADAHTCAVTTAGGVKCWGANGNGQLGDGTTITRPTAVDVTGLTSGVATVAVGLAHTCALTTGGGVKCWGFNLYGLLGDGTTTDRLEPVDVVGLGSGVVAIAAGQFHTCALTIGGGVKCWGYNDQGAVGNGTLTTTVPTPVDVTGLGSGVAAIAAGQYHTCAVTTSGGARCWGFNELGGLGDGTTMQRLEPVDVVGLDSGVAAISGGYYHTCALTTAGGVKCWGYNEQGALGDGTTTQRTSPVDVTGLASGIASIAAGGFHSCALTSTGRVECWGNNAEGELGDGSTTQRTTPVNVSDLQSGVTAISAGTAHGCALMADGGVRCWGGNASGQLGNGLTSYRLAPVAASVLTDGVTAMAGGLGHQCVLTTAGGVKCWGANFSGQLGDGSTLPRRTPADVVGLASGVAEISAKGGQTCALTTTGGVKCWGDNSNGQLGDGTMTTRTTPVDVVGLGSGVAAIATGNWFTCALTTAGGVKCWGHNAFGELGDGTTTRRLTPVDVSGLASGVTAIAAGAITTCALTAAGGVKCWGYNGTGDVGDGTTTHRSTPVDVSGLTSGVQSIALGLHQACAVTTAGAARCWGENIAAQLGDGTTTRRSTPVGVTGLGSGVTAIGGGNAHTCALTSAGGVKCWGDSTFGEVGDGTQATHTTPVDVAGLGSGVAAISPAWWHTCALLDTGGVACWGLNGDGQLGNGERGYETDPVVTVGFGPACGNGIVEPTEQCDDGNTSGGDCCSSTCHLESGATVCRPATGPCDTAETCTGSSTACPADAFAIAGTVCADDGNVCTDDACDGAGACAHAPNAAPCDDGAFCTGFDTCAGGSCAVHSGDPCVGGAECAATCNELLDTCNAVAGTACSSDGNACTLDVCDGAGACGHPAGHAGTICRAVAGDCDVAESCDGTSPFCPSDVFRSSSQPCRPASGVCDVAESCTGASATCPVDVFVTNGTACTDDGEPCTNDACDGAGQCVHDVLPDSDGDTTCDAQDACTNVAGGRSFVVKPKSKLVLGKIHSDTMPGNDTVALKATFALPAGTAFADLDPRMRGARVTVRGALGASVLDAWLPGGTYAGKGTRGWRSNGNRSVWLYLDKTATPLGGITLIRAIDRGAGLPGGLVAVTVDGKRATYPIATSDVPLQATVTLGNQSDAIAGWCGESAYAASDCVFNGRANALTCTR
ncbi:DUF4215 domain-containing protein [Candidatus Binatia bacterium]|nr:DUF4215 domain-containing protein [Candidatus Binatia bacterium]